MQLHLFIHLARKRAKTITLLDSGATENFLNMQYAKEMCFPIKRLEKPRPIYNVDWARGCHARLSVAVLYLFKFYWWRPCALRQASKSEDGLQVFVFNSQGGCQ